MAIGLWPSLHIHLLPHTFTRDSPSHHPHPHLTGWKGSPSNLSWGWTTTAKCEVEIVWAAGTVGGTHTALCRVEWSRPSASTQSEALVQGRRRQSQDSRFAVTVMADTEEGQRPTGSLVSTGPARFPGAVLRGGMTGEDAPRTAGEGVPSVRSGALREAEGDAGAALLLPRPCGC
jgi:hypothetical protein